MATKKHSGAAPAAPAKNITDRGPIAPHGLRCRSGDLAIINASALPNDGKFVVVLCRSVPWTEEQVGGPCWVVESLGAKLSCWSLRDHSAPLSYAMLINVLDSHLTPLRDRPGIDESLRWAKRPKLRRVPMVRKPTPVGKEASHG